MSFIASKNYVLQSGKDYTPGEGIVPADNSTILSIHVLEELNNSIVIEHPNGCLTTLPKTSLHPGAIYPYPVKKIVIAQSDEGKILGISPNYKVDFF